MAVPQAEIEFRDNRILSALSSAELARIGPLLTGVQTEPRESYWEPELPIPALFFPTSSVNSVIALDGAGGEVEVATVGNEGMVGLPLFLGAERATTRAFTQIGGHGWRMERGAFLEVVEALPTLRTRLNRYTQAFVSHVSQSVACNRLHDPHQRLARWMLSCADRVGEGRFPLTQEFMAQMLGVRRATVNEAAQALQERGLLRYSRGMIQILDRSGLVDAACPCYRIVRDEYNRLLGEPNR